LPQTPSPAFYRAALNRELIKRRPGKYSQNWLGDRLNMSERTVQRYLKRENIHSRQLLEEIRIDWNKLNQIPNAYSAKRAGFDMQPYFLEDEQSNRYPPKPEIAKKLLKQKHSVWLMRRSIKMYWYDQEPIPKISLEQKTKFVSTERALTKPDHPTSSNEGIVPAQSMPVQPNVSVIEVVPFPKNTLKPQQDLEKQPKRADRFYKSRLPEDADERLAQKVYRATVG